MGVKLGFHEAMIHASFTPRAVLAAVNEKLSLKKERLGALFYFILNEN